MADFEPTASVQAGFDGGGGTRLLVFGGALPRAHELPERGRIVLGRNADVSIDHKTVSRHHAALHIGDELHVEDLGSRNGTTVGGRRLARSERAVVEPGEQFLLGEVVCIVQRPRVATSPSSPPAGASSASSAMARAEQLMTLVAKSDLSVLIHAETGAGKDVAARSIHAQSSRAAEPFVGINCAALPEQLLESELFGYEKGAFSGAVTAKQGLFEAAGNGTIFLDEIGDMPMSMQAKLLRALETKSAQRLGALKPRPVNARFIAATHRDLRAEVAAGRFREDLLYRLNGMTVALPPLRERPGAVAELAARFLDEACARLGRSRATLSREALARLVGHRWPGNVRELKTVIERALVLLGDGPVVGVEHVLIDGAPSPAPASPVTSSGDDAERQRVLDALAQAAGNQTRAAEILGVSRRTLINRLESLGIKRPRKG